MIPRILLLNENRRANGLTLALRRRGAMVTTAALADIAFDSTAPNGLTFPRLGKRLPDAVFVRSIAAGSFEAITRRLGILHALEKMGVPVWNSAGAIERCVDKSMTTFLLAHAGLPTPATFAVEGIEAARAIATRECPAGALVLKPLFGAQGQGIRLIHGPDDLPSREEVANVFYLQRYIPRAGPPFQDFRVFVCAGRAVAMMSRRNDDWITNVNRGGKPVPTSRELEGELSRLAIAAAAAVGASFAGVDILFNDGGKAFVLEVNSMPAWSGLQSVSSVNIAGELADAFLDHLAEIHAAEPRRPIRFVSPANS
ncbi:MAG: RimK family alpha-L-glutamate ligase [Rhizobiaceae bacterium]